LNKPFDAFATYAHGPVGGHHILIALESEARAYPYEKNGEPVDWRHEVKDLLGASATFRVLIGTYPLSKPRLDSQIKFERQLRDVLGGAPFLASRRATDGEFLLIFRPDYIRERDPVVAWAWERDGSLRPLRFRETFVPLQVCERNKPFAG